MTLKEKFAQFTKQEVWEKMNYNAKECELIADDYAIEFAEWLLWQDITQRGKNNFVCADGVERNTNELLEIFKKEKGL